MNKKMVPLKIEATIKYPEDIVSGFKFAKQLFHSRNEILEANNVSGLFLNEVIVFHDQEVVLERWADFPHFCLYPNEIKKIHNYQEWEYNYETLYVKKQYIKVDKILEYCVIAGSNKQIHKQGQKYIFEFRNTLFILDRCSLELIEKVLNTFLENIQTVTFTNKSLDLEDETDVIIGSVWFGHEGELVTEYFKVIAPELFSH